MMFSDITASPSAAGSRIEPPDAQPRVSAFPASQKNKPNGTEKRQ